MNQNKQTQEQGKRPSKKTVGTESPCTANLKIKVFTAVMAFFTLLGLAWFLRPTESALEKRTLTAFPTFTWQSFISGDYLSQLSLWYSDTYPGRELWVKASQALKNTYGIRSEQIIGGPGGGEEIPDVTTSEGGQIIISDKAQTGTATVTTDPSGTTEPKPSVTTDPGTGTDRPDPEPERLGSLYIAGDTAYDLYYFASSTSDRYASLISRAGEKLAGSATVYDIIIPLSCHINLSDANQKKIGVSNGENAISYMFSKMKNVKTVGIYPTLKAHNDEYLYFRTDHHWTALGAYYAYCVYATTRGMDATPLSDYTVTTYEGFLGTYYSEQPDNRMKADTITAYIPRATNAIYITDRSGTRQKYSQGIVTPDIGRMYSAKGSQYNCFILGDNPLSEIHNPNKSDGSSVLVIKESFGNAFVPFLVDSYEDVYVIDYRYYTGDLTAFVREHGIKDVIFINNLSATGASARLGELERLIGD